MFYNSYSYIYCVSLHFWGSHWMKKIYDKEEKRLANRDRFFRIRGLKFHFKQDNKPFISNQ